MEDFDDFQLAINKKSSETSRHSNLLLDARESIDCYLSQLSKSESSLSKSLFEFLGSADRKKEIRVRLVIAISPENIELAKELTRKFSVYHTNGSGGDFCIIDGNMYFYDIENSNDKMAGFQRRLFSKNSSFVTLQDRICLTIC